MKKKEPTGTQRLIAFIAERHSIYLKKRRGIAAPWTDDPILRAYRFCNVYRELDTETAWIRHMWRQPYSHDPDLWFAMVVARLVNWHETLNEIEYPVPFKPNKFISVIQARRGAGLKAFSGAYIVSTNGHEQDKAEYLAEHVLSPLWKDRKKLRISTMNFKNKFDNSLAEYHRLLNTYNGMGSFMAAQIVADIKYVSPVTEASDWWTWAASGPGSRRGLNRVIGRPVNAPWKEDGWWLWVDKLRAEVNDYFNRRADLGVTSLHAQDFQNCLCEFDKYERTRLGQGKPRSRYQGVQP